LDSVKALRADARSAAVFGASPQRSLFAYSAADGGKKIRRAHMRGKKLAVQFCGGKR
jgi:hypothetical protein